MKSILTAGIILAATPVVSQEATRIKIYDHNTIVTTSQPYTETKCQDVKVPIYTQTQSNNSGDVLMGAIIGGLLGGTASGKDEGAAAGAVIGGLIANENSKQPQVSGYQLQTKCHDVTMYSNQQREVYSHSTIRFYIGDKRYVVKFIK